LPIKFFSLIDSVLTTSMDSACSAQSLKMAKAIAQANTASIDTQEAYFEDGKQVKYFDAITRWAYLYTYVAAHASLVNVSFKKFMKLRKILDDKINAQEDINICSIGGGPGSELLGIIKYFETYREEEQNLDINFIIIDKIIEWDETWNALVKGVHKEYAKAYGKNKRSWPVMINHSFLGVDVTDKDKFNHFTERFQDVNVIILNHIISELRTTDNFEKGLQTIFKTLPRDAVFLVIDINQEEVRSAIEKVFGSGDVTLLREIYEDGHLDYDEQKADMKTWYGKLNRDPKITWDVYIALYEFK
jgi:hypothetical protein